MQIRPATNADVTGIMDRIARAVPLMNAAGNFQWDNTYPNERIFLEDIDANQLWVAEIDGVIAGVAAITTDQDEEYAMVGWDLNEEAIVTHRLAVHPDYRGKGIAAALLQRAEDEARRRNIAILRIDTNSENKATQALFPKLGYIFSGEISLNFRPGLKFFCYEKRL